MVTFSLIIIVMYAILVCWFYRGWNKTPDFFVQQTEFPLSVSVVVCAHNEEESLPRLLDSLSNQSCSPYEIVVVNDHSTDGTANVLEDWKSKMSNLKVVNPKGRGKKKSLAEGVAACKGEIILQTDADCMVSSEWVETISSSFSDKRCDLLIGPVAMNYSNCWEAAQSLEFLSLVASGAGAAGNERAIMCNGANLAYKKDLWTRNAGKQHSELLSGDDMFLLLAAKKEKAKILFLKSKEAIVWTYPCRTLQDFIRQRQRWASKSGSYRDADVIMVAMGVMAVALTPIVDLLFGKWQLFLGMIFFKMIVDFIFLRKVSVFFGLEKSVNMIFFVELLYPFYIVYCGVSGLFRKKSW